MATMLEVLNEIAAVQLAFSECSMCIHPSHINKAVQHIQQGDESAACDCLTTQGVDIHDANLTLHPITLEITVNRNSEAEQGSQALLSFDITNGYPSMPIHNVQLICSGQGSQDDLLQINGLLQELKDVAEEAASQALPSLFDIIDHAVRSIRDMEVKLDQQQPCLGQQGDETTSRHTEPALQPNHQEQHGITPMQTMEQGLSSGQETCQQPQIELLVVRLDHMHNKAMYVKTLRAWMSGLGITGRLVFYNSAGSKSQKQGGASGLILLLLQGQPDQLKQYLAKHRTETVDVDSRGRKCRERMMQVLLQRPYTSNQAFDDYSEVQADDISQVMSILDKLGLQDYKKELLGIREKPRN